MKTFPTDYSRATFKKEVKTALRHLEEKYNIEISLDRLDEDNGTLMNGIQMKLRAKKVNTNDNLWDSPAEIALVDAKTRLEIYRKLDAASFCPHIAVKKMANFGFRLALNSFKIFGMEIGLGCLVQPNGR